MNSTFDNTYGVADQALALRYIGKVYISSVNFTRNPSPSGLTLLQLVNAKVNTTITFNISALIDVGILAEITSNTAFSYYGFVHIESALSTVPITSVGNFTFNFTSQYLGYSEFINCLFSDTNADMYSAIYALGSNIRVYNDPVRMQSTGFWRNTAQ